MQKSNVMCKKFTRELVSNSAVERIADTIMVFWELQYLWL